LRYELNEQWERCLAVDSYLRGVVASTGEFFEGMWQVDRSAGEYFREDMLGLKLREGFKSAPEAVPRVSSVLDLRWETWEVGGNPSGEELCRAAAAVVDEFADRMRAAYDAPS
jgi:hypothetical protein